MSRVGVAPSRCATPEKPRLCVLGQPGALPPFSPHKYNKLRYYNRTFLVRPAVPRSIHGIACWTRRLLLPSHVVKVEFERPPGTFCRDTRAPRGVCLYNILKYPKIRRRNPGGGRSPPTLAVIMVLPHNEPMPPPEESAAPLTCSKAGSQAVGPASRTRCGGRPRPPPPAGGRACSVLGAWRVRRARFAHFVRSWPRAGSRAQKFKW